MSEQASDFVVRHVRGITLPQRAILDIYARLSNSAGQTRITQWGVAAIVELSQRQVERHVKALRELGHLVREGRNWIVCGVAEHDLRTCDHPWCVKQYRHQCKPKLHRPRRVADPDAWKRLPKERPQPATVAAAAADGDSQARERRPSWRSKFKRRGGRP